MATLLFIKRGSSTNHVLVPVAGLLRPASGTGIFESTLSLLGLGTFPSIGILDSALTRMSGFFLFFFRMFNGYSPYPWIKLQVSLETECVL